MTEASYQAWDDNLYEWPPPAGWYQADDGKWWPEGHGPDDTVNTASGVSSFDAGDGERAISDDDEDDDSDDDAYDGLPSIDDVFGGADPFADEDPVPDEVSAAEVVTGDHDAVVTGNHDIVVPGQGAVADDADDPLAELADLLGDAPASPEPPGALSPDPVFAEPAPTGRVPRNPAPPEDEMLDVEPEDGLDTEDGEIVEDDDEAAEGLAEVVELGFGRRQEAEQPRRRAREHPDDFGDAFDAIVEGLANDSEITGEHDQSGFTVGRGVDERPHDREPERFASDHGYSDLDDVDHDHDHDLDHDLDGHGDHDGRDRDHGRGDVEGGGLAHVSPDRHDVLGATSGVDSRFDDLHSDEHDVVSGEAPVADDRVRSGSSGPAWPLVVLGVVVVLLAVGLVGYLVARSGNGSADDTAQVVPQQVGPGSSNEPYDFGTPVAVYYDDQASAEQTRWVVQVLEPVGDRTSQLVADVGAEAPAEGEVLALTRVRLTYESGPATASPSELRFNAVSGASTFTDSDNGCTATVDPLPVDVEMAPGDVLEGNVCWRVPTTDFAALDLTVEARAALGAVHLSLR